MILLTSEKEDRISAAYVIIIIISFNDYYHIVGQ